MPVTSIRGVSINYEILGTRGPWLALSPGGRRALEVVKPLAKRLADAGCRVLLHDRRNCGASDVVIDAEKAEHEIWADDLYALLEQHDALPAFIGGPSSGCRLALQFALAYPDAVRGLLLWRATGGAYATHHLADNYYGDFIKAAKQGGMDAVCETEHFKERIAARPSNRDKLMKMEPARFIDIMARWRDSFMVGLQQPVIGASEDDLRSIKVPACIIPGNDRVHPRAVGKTLGALMPNNELHDIMQQGPDLEEIPFEEWDRKEGEVAAIFVKFLQRVNAEMAPA